MEQEKLLKSISNEQHTRKRAFANKMRKAFILKLLNVSKHQDKSSNPRQNENKNNTGHV
jgi:hypothetical protein